MFRHSRPCLINEAPEGSTFCNDAECSHTLGIDFVEEGQIINGVGGDATFLAIYEQMYAAIRDGNFPQVTSLPGAQAVRDRLAARILKYGGTLAFPRSAWERTITTLCVTDPLPQSGERLRSHAERGNDLSINQWKSDERASV